MSKSVAGVSAGGTPPSGAIVKQDGRTLVDTEHPDYLKLTEIAREGYRHAASFEGIAHAILLEGFSRAGGTPSDSERLTAIAERITQYLSVGGLFNPESMDHSKVRDLLMDCRTALSAVVPEQERGAAKENTNAKA